MKTVFVLFDNDAPLCALLDPTREQASQVLQDYKTGEQVRIEKQYGNDHLRPKRVMEEMQRHYFHYHEVPLIG